MADRVMYVRERHTDKQGWGWRDKMRTVFREGEEKPQASRGGQAVRKGDGARFTQADLPSVCWKHRQKKQNLRTGSSGSPASEQQAAPSV